MYLLAAIIIATLLISLISLIGIIFLSLRKKTLNKILMCLVAFSAGALLGGAFLHLLPESFKQAKEWACIGPLAGIVIFFIIEKFLKWRHCHKERCPVHTFGYMNLIGDAIHNFTDGVIIAASFLVSIPFGVITTIAIALHEIPQEIGDFGVLVYSGFKVKKALVINLIAALTAILGGIFGYFISKPLTLFSAYTIPIAAGGFIYIASSDLIPELHKETSTKKSLRSFAFLVLGVLFLYFIKMLF